MCTSLHHQDLIYHLLKTQTDSRSESSLEDLHEILLILFQEALL